MREILALLVLASLGPDLVAKPLSLLGLGASWRPATGLLLLLFTLGWLLLLAGLAEGRAYADAIRRSRTRGFLTARISLIMLSSRLVRAAAAVTAAMILAATGRRRRDGQASR